MHLVRSVTLAHGLDATGPGRGAWCGDVQAPRARHRGRSDDGAPARRGRPPGSGWSSLVVVCALVSMWGYVLYLAFGPGRQPPIDRLDDPAFAAAAEERCAATLEEVDGCQSPSASPTAVERARRAGSGRRRLRGNARRPRRPRDVGARRRPATAGQRVAGRLAHLSRRPREVRRRPTHRTRRPRLLVSEKPGEGQQITGWIDEFANANRMPSCVTPTDA